MIFVHSTEQHTNLNSIYLFKYEVCIYINYFSNICNIAYQFLIEYIAFLYIRKYFNFYAYVKKREM